MAAFTQDSSLSSVELLSTGMNSSTVVKGFTHAFYKYPARFSPQFVRAILDLYSSPGDVVLDPFMGGGTAIVESLAKGRRAIGVDLNALAHFVTTVKTTPLSKADKDAIRDWVTRNQLTTLRGETKVGLQVPNLPLRVQRMFEPVLDTLQNLHLQRQRRFVRCLLLKCSQWALDCRDTTPTVKELNNKINAELFEMLNGLDQWVVACKATGFAKTAITQNRRLLLRSSKGLENHPLFANNEKLRAKLVLTSPPYPGVHILYHRWQINGRRETPAPFWLAGLRDGQSEAFYTLGGRSRQGIETYFNEITQTFRSIRSITRRDSLVVQLVSFAETDEHLPRYLQSMEAAGFALADSLPSGKHSLMWRRVPNRKWYSQMRKNHDAGKEVLLIHKHA